MTVISTTTFPQSMNILSNRRNSQTPDPKEPHHSTTASFHLSSGQQRFSYSHRVSAEPTPSLKGSRRSFAALARERTSTAFANLASIGSTSHGTLRSHSSTGSLSRISFSENPFLDKNESYEPADSISLIPERPSEDRGLSNPPISRRASHVPSLSADTSSATYNKMHQTSSRLLRMTDDERPFVKDFKDLFSTLMVSLPLNSHRVRFQKIEHTFTSEEAINNLGSLKFSQSNRMPDPKDPSRIVTTTTTTTFSMAKEMARSVCQRFMEARLIESTDGKQQQHFPLKGAVWQLTPKGINILQFFCQRNGINQKHVLDVLDGPRNTMQLVRLERDEKTDRLSADSRTMEVIFRRFAGSEGPNAKQSTSTSDSDSLNDYYNGIIGVKMAKERKIFDKVIQNTFTGKAGVDWLMDCCIVIDKQECNEICERFVKSGLIWAVVEDKGYMHQNPSATLFQPTKSAIYALTEKGQRVAGWISREKTATNGDDSKMTSRDSNNNRLNAILTDPGMRLLFREFLRDTHCEENLSFYVDVKEFIENYKDAEKVQPVMNLETVRETLAAAYGLYNAFLAPGSPCELNIDHNLRNSLASRMTRAVGDDESLFKSLQEVMELFENAKNSVFKLMSSDSVPKFIREPRYASVLREHNLDTQSHSPTSSTTVLPERNASRSARSARS
ncbi:MAG: hypothetical protein M1834_003923 [Cirrosporium novae-zelandiae]|nr:MAG: hypothetical protein M1834_003923 [Cirrosporium novae-zelandiae]